MSEEMRLHIDSWGGSSISFTTQSCDGTTEPSVVLKATTKSGNTLVTDLEPLISHIGGTVETKLVPAGDFEPVTIYDMSDTPPETFPAVAYFPSELNALLSFDTMEHVSVVLDDNSIVGVVPSSYSWYESPSFILLFYLFPSSDDNQPFLLSNISGFNPSSAPIPYVFSYSTIQELLDAGGTLPLNILAVDSATQLPAIVDDFPVQYYLHVELCEAQNGACYRFTVLTGAVENKPVLHLEPSCDTDIDLMPAIGDSLTSVSASFSCSGIPTDISSGYAAHIYYSDDNSTIYDEYINNITQAPLVLHIPSGCTSIFVEFYGDLYYSFSIDLSTAHIGEVHCVTGGGMPE